MEVTGPHAKRRDYRERKNIKKNLEAQDKKKGWQGLFW